MRARKCDILNAGNMHFFFLPGDGKHNYKQNSANGKQNKDHIQKKVNRSISIICTIWFCDKQLTKVRIEREKMARISNTLKNVKRPQVPANLSN